MIIETKFDIGETVLLIENNIPMFLKVRTVEYVNNTVRYSFLYQKATTNLDNDKVVERDECQCFKSIKELSDFYGTE